MSTRIDIRHKTIAISTHYLIYSASQALRDFVRKEGCRSLIYISHPLPLPDSFHDRSYREISNGTKIVSRDEASHRFMSLFASVVYELYLTFTWILSFNSHIDIFIAVDNLNAFQAILLKWLGRTDRVVYYTIDMFPKRFESRLLNWLYVRLDRFCVRFSDETWNVSDRMMIVRGILPEKQYTVPIGIWFDAALRKPFSAIDTKKIIFVGHLVDHMGVDLVIRAMPELKKHIQGVSFDIIGGGEELARLERLSRSLHVEDVIKFHGWVRNRTQLEKLLAHGAVGIAPFNTEILDEKVRNADPGKIKDYMQAGMPVIVTDALANGDSISRARAGIVIPYAKDALIAAVTNLLNHEDTLRQYRANALRYVKQFDYRTLFSHHLSRLV